MGARVEHPNDEIEAAVVVRDHRKDSGFLLPQAPEIHLIGLRHFREGFQVELFQPGDKGDLDGFQGLTAAGVVVAVVFQGDVFRVP